MELIKDIILGCVALGLLLLVLITVGENLPPPFALLIFVVFVLCAGFWSINKFIDMIDENK